jgi:CHAT domain-containing protein/tetratricopeptide (TPR) repeat protein
VAALTLVAGCRTNWQTRYSEARFQLRQGHADDALRLADSGYRDSEGHDPLWNWNFRILKAEALLRQKPKETVSLLEPEPPANLPLEISARRKIFTAEALCAQHKGPDAAAAALLTEAESRIPPAERALIAEVAFARATCAISSALPEALPEAQGYYRRAAEFARGVDPYMQANALTGVAYLLGKDERYDEAIVKLEEALPLNDSPLVREGTLGNLGYNYLQVGELERSISFLQQAETAAASVGETRDQGEWNTVLGNAALAQHDYPQANRSYLKALSLAQTARNNDSIATALHNLSQLYLAQGDLDQAEKYNRQAFEAEGLNRDDISGRKDPYLLLSAAEIAKARGELAKSEELLTVILHDPGIRAAMRRRAESDLAAVCVAQKKFPEADRHFREALRIVETARSKVVGEEHRISILDAWPFYDDYIDFLISQNNPNQALRIAEFSRARTLADGLGINGPSKTADISLQKTQFALRQQNQIVLAYWLSEKGSYLWVVSPHQIKFFRLAAREEIEREIQVYTGEILAHAQLENSARGKKLYQMLVQPAEKLIGREARVVIIPHRSLYKLNFETIVVPAAPAHYWIDDVRVETAASLALLNRPHQKPASGAGKLLLIGNPVSANAEFPVLVHAQEEIQQVSHHFLAAEQKVLSGKEATPSAYTANASGEFRVVHFVTHGKANETVPMESAIILSSDADKDYKLYARDIVKFPIHADLVTISACYSAGKRAYAGEGLVGLAWAFLRAGAHQVVAGLWEVDDAATPELMDHFYAELQKGTTAADALRGAKRMMLHSKTVYERPFYWASLQLYTGQ